MIVSLTERTNAMKVGDVFTVPLRVGGFGAAVVIDTNAGFTFLVLDGFWQERPTAANLEQLTEMPLPFGQQPLPGHAGVFKGWFEGTVPSDFSVVTNRRLSETQKAMRGPEGTMVFQNARHFARTLSDQWRWLNDRDAYLHELRAAAADYEKANAERRKALTLEGMLNETFFTSWGDRWSDEQLTEARRIFNDATAKLIAIQKNGTPKKRSAILRGIVKEFNEFDNTTGLVESVERDDIVQRVTELAELVGLDNDAEKLTRRRTW